MGQIGQITKLKMLISFVSSHTGISWFVVSNLFCAFYSFFKEKKNIFSNIICQIWTLSEKNVADTYNQV